MNFNASIATFGWADVATIPCLNGADKSIDAINVLGILSALENTSTAFSGEVLLAYICFNLLIVKSCLTFISASLDFWAALKASGKRFCNSLSESNGCFFSSGAKSPLAIFSFIF